MQSKLLFTTSRTEERLAEFKNYPYIRWISEVDILKHLDTFRSIADVAKILKKHDLFSFKQTFDRLGHYPYPILEIQAPDHPLKPFLYRVDRSNLITERHVARIVVASVDLYKRSRKKLDEKEIIKRVSQNLSRLSLPPETIRSALKQGIRFGYLFNREEEGFQGPTPRFYFEEKYLEKLAKIPIQSSPQVAFLLPWLIPHEERKLSELPLSNSSILEKLSQFHSKGRSITAHRGFKNEVVSAFSPEIYQTSQGISQSSGVLGSIIQNGIRNLNHYYPFDILEDKRTGFRRYLAYRLNASNIITDPDTAVVIGALAFNLNAVKRAVTTTELLNCALIAVKNIPEEKITSAIREGIEKGYLTHEKIFPGIEEMTKVEISYRTINEWGYLQNLMQKSKGSYIRAYPKHWISSPSR